MISFWAKFEYKRRGGGEGSLSFEEEVRAAHPTPSVPPIDDCLATSGLTSLDLGSGVAVVDATRRRRAIERMVVGLRRWEEEGMVGGGDVGGSRDGDYVGID